MHILSWHARRQWKLWIIWLGFCIFSASLSLVLALVHPYGFGKISQQSSEEQIRDKVGPFGNYLDDPRLHNLAAAHPNALAALFGIVVFGGFATLNRRTWVHDRFWASFNNDILTPMSPLQRPDKERNSTNAFVQLPWVLGTTGPRHIAWVTVNEWCSRSNATLSGKLKHRLSLAVLAGQSGSGKSRMAYEVARHLTRCDVADNKSSTASLRWRVGVYFRHVVPGLRRRHDDPWDAGLLVRKDQDNDFAQFCARLAQWRPRRPTFLVLDDPEQKGVERCWNALTSGDADRPYAYPVCLLIVSQTIPAEAGLEYSPFPPTWMRGKDPADPQPILLPVEAWLTPEETRTTAFASGYLWDKSVQVDKIIRDDLYRITSGNPLLVQLAVEWLRDNHPVADLSAEVLTSARASRILTALQHRGVVEEAQIAALVLATLVGGALRNQVEAAVRRIFGNFTPLPSYLVLKACFPTEPLDPGADLRLPAVRPDFIGDAFIDHVLAVIGSDRAVALAEAGFDINAARMLRSVRRIRPRTSAMTAALALINTRKIEHLDPVELALAFADVATVCQPDYYPLSTAAYRKDIFSKAQDLISKLETQNKIQFCKKFVQRCDLQIIGNSQRQLRPTAAMRLVTETASDPEVQVPIDIWIAMFRLLRMRAVGEFGPADGILHAALAVRSEDVLDDLVNAVWDMGRKWHLALTPVWRALAERYEAEGNLARAHRFKTMAAILEPNNARLSAEAVEQLAMHNPNDFALQKEAAVARRYEAVAWCQVPIGAQAAAAREAADACASLAARFPDDPSIQLEAIIARRFEASAWSEVFFGAQATAVQAAADACVALAARFANEIVIQLEATTARRLEAQAWSQVLVGAQATMAREAADACVRLAMRFPGDPSIQREAASARCCEVYAWSRVPAGAKAAEAQAAADASAALAARFPDDPSIQREAADARSWEASAYSHAPAGTQATAAQAAANACAKLAARFPDDSAIHCGAADAHRSEAYAWSRVPAGAQARAAADACAVLAARFLDEPFIQTAAMEARRCEASAWSRVPAGAQATAAQAAADACVALAAGFPDDPSSQLVSTMGRRCEAYAWCQVPSGEQATATQAAADACAKLAARFPDNPAIQIEAMIARRCEASAWSQVPAGAGAAAARTAADACVALSTRFPRNLVNQREATSARRCEAFAWGQLPAGAGAAAAHAAANACAAFAACFPDNPSIQLELTMARRSEAYAWSRVPAGAEAAAAHVAATACATLAKQFPGEPNIQREAVEARRCEDYAWSRSR